MKSFLEENKHIILFAAILTLCIYGVRIFSYNISVDTDLYISKPFWFNQYWHLAEGKYAFSLLELIFQGFELKLNIFFANVLSVIFLVASNVVWLYSLYTFAELKSKLLMSVFSLFYLSSSIWVEIIYFTMMAAEVTFGILLCAVSCYFTFKGIFNNDLKMLLASTLLLTFTVSIWLPLITLYVAGVLIVYIMRAEKLEMFSDTWVGGYIR